MNFHVRGIFLTVFILLVFGFSLASKTLLGEKSEEEYPSPKAYKRIVSLSPSVTEMLFALGLGGRIVGVTQYCDYPPEATKKEKVGGYSNPNYEAIVSLKPDLVVILPEQKEVGKHLSSLGLDVLTVNNRTVGDILESIHTIGKICVVEKRASDLVSGLRGRMEAIRGRTANLTRPRALVSVARGMGSLGIKTVYIAGKGGYYDELIELAGGVNVYRDEKVRFPTISREGLIALTPDVILDLVPSVEEKGWNAAAILKEWEALDEIKAVKDGRVYVLGRDYVTVPGPRFILLLEDMAKAMHPDIRVQ